MDFNPIWFFTAYYSGSFQVWVELKWLYEHIWWLNFLQIWTILLLICCHINLDEVHEKLEMGSIFESTMKWSFLRALLKQKFWCLSEWFNDTHYLIYVLLPPNVIWTCIVEWSWMWSGGETKPSVILVPCWCQLLSSLSSKVVFIWE